MTKQEQDKAILEGAPEGATHFDDPAIFRYLKDDGYYWNGSCWRYEDEPYSLTYTRSLDDIRELVALRDEVAEKDKRIAELKEDNERLREYYKLFKEQIKFLQEKLERGDV
jgi:hypothetical protein